MAKKAVVLIANGSEEMEAVIAIDVLRRAEITVTVAGVGGVEPKKCSRGVNIVPDIDITSAIEAAPYDVVVLPGGNQGAQTFAESSDVKKLLEIQLQHSCHIGAICAAPIALKSHGIIQKETRMTSHPAVRNIFSDFSYSEARVVQDNKIITSRGPGTSFEFALAIVEALCGKDVKEKVASPLILP